MKRGKRSPVDRLKESLRGDMVEALLDAARERRKTGTLQEMAQAIFLAHCAVHHSLELAESYLILEET